ncbi:MAG: radical SAM protein, partial [Phycisphaerae bacterium]
MTTVLQRLRPRRPIPARWTRRRTQSLCPRCLAVIDAELICHDNQIFMRKTCPQHGPFKELISTDADFFMRLERLSTTTDAPSAVLPEQAGPHERADQQTSRCPNQCGICPQHRSGAVMVNIDLTNRCNLRCPICFANSDAAGYLYEVTRQQVRQMLRRIMETNRPAPACIQFSGGEPTLHPEFIEILADAHQAGFAQVQVASNGLRFARQPDFAQRCSDAGLNIVYLQFDGLDDRNYLRTRGARLLELKLQAIENIYNAGMRTCLVPTIVKGINDD